MPRWRWCCRKKSPGRPFSELFLSSKPYVKEFFPRPCLSPTPIELTYPEYEVIKLIDQDDLTQEEVAKRMGTSRGTVWRLYQSGRKKLAQALIESRPLLIIPKGKVEVVR